MRSVTRLLTTAAGLAVAFAVAAVPAIAKPAQKADASAAPKRQFSKEFATTLAPYEKALAAQDYATASAAVEAARPKAKSPDEVYTVNQIALLIATRQGDTAAQSRAVEAMLSSGAATAMDMAKLNVFLAGRAYNDKRDADALRFANAAKAAGSTDPAIDQILASSAVRQGDFAGAIASTEARIAAMKAAGQAPDEATYRQLVGYAQQGKDVALQDRYSQQWVSAYPTPANWRVVLMNSMAGRKLEDSVQLDYFRLMRATNALSSSDDWRGYAELASFLNLNGEVLAAVNAGTSAGVLNNQSVQEIYARSKSKQSEDRASLVSEAKTAAAKTQAKPVAAAADALVGYGDYAKAVDLYRIALTKPGVNTDEVTMRMGIAQALAGRFADAKASFAKVQGERQVLATYWTLWVDRQMGA